MPESQASTQRRHVVRSVRVMAVSSKTSAEIALGLLE
jgi:hypothetical protein